jgi:hypothetical protein
MWHPFYLLGILLWVLVALWPAFIAKGKGYSFILFWLISIPFWWITLFVTLIMKPRAAQSAPIHKETEN